MKMAWRRCKFTLAAAFCQGGLLALFVIFVRYGDLADAKINSHPKLSPITKCNAGNATEVHAVDNLELTYPMFTDVHVMVFVGFGFLMTFLKRYGYGSVGFSFIIAVLSIQWATIIRGFFLHKGDDIPVDVTTLVTVDFCAASVLISFGAVIGRASPLQLLIMAVIEVVLYQLNEWLCYEIYHISDIGGSITIHTFGAYFGLAVSAWLYDRQIHEVKHKKAAIYHADLFSMIGTLFLWLFWPSFNAATARDDERYRAVINTFYSLCACTMVTAIASTLTNKEDKFEMEHFQNAALAGGVGIGAVADLQIHPWGAIIIGMVTGFVSVIGFRYITPRLNRYVYDTCGVNNLHGMPGVLSGVASIIVARVLEYEDVGDSLYDTYPKRCPDHDGYWSALKQCGMQVAGLFTAIGIALVGGFFTGMILRLPIWNQPEVVEMFDDEVWWDIPTEGYGCNITANTHGENTSPPMYTSKTEVNNAFQMSSF